MEDDLKKNGRQPQKRWKTTYKLFIFKLKKTSKKIKMMMMVGSAL